MQAVCVAAVGGLVAVANYATFKPIYHELFDQRKKREFFDVMCVSCVGDALKFHEHGKRTGCPGKPRYVATLVNLASQRDEQVWLCHDHFLEVEKVDQERLKTHRWQDLPFPRWTPNELTYPPHDLDSSIRY
jgi:hypothetical protein